MNEYIKKICSSIAIAFAKLILVVVVALAGCNDNNYGKITEMRISKPHYVDRHRLGKWIVGGYYQQDTIYWVEYLDLDKEDTLFTKVSKRDFYNYYIGDIIQLCDEQGK